MQIGLTLGAIGIFSMLAYWRGNAIAFFVCAGISLMAAFQFFDTYDNDFALGVSLMLLLWAINCIGQGIRQLLWANTE